ncbi:DUF6226 family protein [Promicromonospora sp. NPDC052451]|uniref:DUF6226 family protein n=1 Tax=Promicromonospora sp. NPDC052451 TaxID=3364407 RepID=UPI0037C80A9C
MESTQLIARVDAEFARLDPPRWPNPHEDCEASEEEYSRVTDPGRYRVVALRARAWSRVLGTVPDIDVEPVAPESLGPDLDGGVRLTSRRPGTLPLLLLERGPTKDSEVPLVRIGMADPDTELELVPDCGCDACDHGSDDLVRGLDEAVVEAMSGIVLMLAGTWRGVWTPDGGGVGGDPGLPELDQVLAWGRRLSRREHVSFPEDVRVLVNDPWM